MAGTDETIKKRIVDALHSDGRVDAAEVMVEVSNSRALLKGSVSSLGARTAAEEDASAVQGVTEVKNEILVRRLKTPAALSDAEIETAVKDALLLNPEIDGAEIEVEVHAGIATLRGTLDALWKRKFAGELAAGQPGVIALENRIAAAPKGKTLDRRLAKDIVLALERSRFLLAEDIEVQVNDGKAVLSGEVPTHSARQSAEEEAMATPGVIAVENRITVSEG